MNQGISNSFNPQTSFYFDQFKRDIWNVVKEYRNKLPTPLLSNEQIRNQTNEKIEEIFEKFKNNVKGLTHEHDLLKVGTEHKNNILKYL